MDKNLKNDILNILKKFNTTPFLFIGSGLTRRYLGLEDWEGLLRKFALMVGKNDFAYEKYKQLVKTQDIKVGELQKIAELIEKDLSQFWYEDELYNETRELYVDDILKGVSPLKIEISKYMNERSKLYIEAYKDEIDLFKNLGKSSISGVITTNYDTFLEDNLNDYIKYIGQEELIFSSIQGIGEIYKIHGCCSKSESIIINEEDYLDFEEKNSYLAAKILTIFLEHPIIFIGYSISDENIKKILKAIVKCLSKDNLEKLKERLIFIEWNNTENEDSISTYSISFDDTKVLEMTKISLKDYSILYEALFLNKAKYSSNMLRKLKQDVYELVLTSSPKEKMRVVGLEDDRLDDIEVVVGVGVLSEFGKKGYSSVTAEEIYRDIVFDDGDLEPELVVNYSLPILLKHHSNSIPIYKYISQVELVSDDKVKKEIKNKYDELLSRTIRDKKQKNTSKEKSIKELISKYSANKCLELIPLLDKENINISDLGEFLRSFYTENPNIFSNGKGNDKTNLRRLIKIYDWLNYYNKKES